MNPQSYKEAMASKNTLEWYKAMCDKMNSFKDSSTWQPVYLPAGCCAIGSHWVFKVKYLSNGAINYFKACLVVQGFSQRPGVDFDTTYALIAHWTAV